MSRITLDETLRTRLNGLNEPLEVCDNDGRVLGHFLPAASYQKLLIAAAEQSCPYSKEDLAAFQQESGGESLHEFWSRMGQA